ncbi:MAG: hypothetical protein JRE28_00220 [Deltaproteobacteria bacterium]|nr:hypothetical protein [Deltaproteobacteria bacterium]
MQNDDQYILYKLFRDHEYVSGVSQTARMTMGAVMDALVAFNGSPEDIRNQIIAFIDAIRCSEPRTVPLINMMLNCENDLKSLNISETTDVQEVKDAIRRVFSAQIDHLEDNISRVVDFGVECVDDGDFIIVYTVSAPVLRILPEAVKRGKDFSVLILDQDVRKTGQVLKKMDETGVSYVMAPEYGLSHFLEQTNKLFLGATAITADSKVVTAAGTANIASIAHLHHLPVYLFANSLKFSKRIGGEQNIHRKTKAGSRNGLACDVISHSHDIVDLKVVDHLITEHGKIRDIAAYRSQLASGRDFCRQL